MRVTGHPQRDAWLHRVLPPVEEVVEPEGVEGPMLTEDRRPLLWNAVKPSSESAVRKLRSLTSSSQTASFLPPTRGDGFSVGRTGA